MVIEFQGPAADGWRASLILQREGLMEQPPEITPGYPILGTDRTEETFLGINQVLDKIQRRTTEDVPFTPVDDNEVADDTECRQCGCDLADHLNDECGPGCGDCGDLRRVHLMTRPTAGSHDRLMTADDFPDCEACQMWQDAGASWPRPCFKHYTAEPVAGAAPAYPEVQNYAPIDSLRDRILVAILDQAATMEQQFPAGPGHVVGVPDAATVAAKACSRWLLWRGVDLAKVEEDRSRAGTAVIVAKVPDEPGKVWFQVEAVPFWPGANGEAWHVGTLDAADAAKVLRDIADSCEQWNAEAVERPDGT